MNFFPSPRDGSAEAFDKKFRLGFAGVVGSDRVVLPLGRARAGIYLLVKNSLTIERTKVVLSPHTIPDVINMVRFAGGRPVFVDCAPNSTNISMDDLERRVDAQTACVVFTHYHVSQAPIHQAHELCRDRGVALFDDCAIALGSSFEGKPIGSLVDGSVFSLSAFKIMNAYWGGALALPEGKLADDVKDEVETWSRLTLLQQRQQIVKVLKFAAATSPALFPLVFAARKNVIRFGKIVDIYPFSRIETPCLDDTIRSRPSAAALNEWVGKLPALSRVIAHRRAIAAIYDRHFRDINLSAETPEALRGESAFANYPIVVGIERRDEVYRSAVGANFDIGLAAYPNVQEMECFRSIPGDAKCLSKTVRSIVSLPTHARVSPAYAEKLCGFLKEHMRRGVCRQRAASASPNVAPLPENVPTPIE